LRVCPRCGFEDPPYWRQNRWVSSVDYSRVEDVLEDYPWLANMRPGEERSDVYNYYYRGKKNPYFIYRWPKVLGPQYYTRTRHLFERHVPRRPPLKGQRTLETGAMVPKVEASA
jgi:hypothetical protein